MKLSVRLISTALLLLLVLLAPEMEMVAEAKERTCETHSHKFKGRCTRRSNCANVCKTEGFPDGHCRGFRRRCFCLKKC